MSYINRPLRWMNEAGIVTAETEKRGKVLLNVKLASGREVKVDITAVDFTDVPSQWLSTPMPIDFSNRDFYGDVARMSAGWKS